jgi:hypothetical protein
MKFGLTSSDKVQLFVGLPAFITLIVGGFHYLQTNNIKQSESRSKSHSEALQKETLKEIKALKLEIEKKDSLHVK